MPPTRLLIISMLFIVSAFSVPAHASAALPPGDVIVYPATLDAAVPAMNDFAVTVNGSSSPVYGAKIGLDHSYIPLPASINSEVVGFTGFDITGSVTAVVTVSNRAVTSARVLPRSYGITPIVNGNTITIPITRYGQYELQLNGPESQPLYLFANPPETNIPQQGAPGVIYLARASTMSALLT